MLVTYEVKLANKDLDTNGRHRLSSKCGPFLAAAMPVAVRSAIVQLENALYLEERINVVEKTDPLEDPEEIYFVPNLAVSEEKKKKRSVEIASILVPPF
jgi:hypothetical protein